MMSSKYVCVNYVDDIIRVKDIIGARYAGIVGKV